MPLVVGIDEAGYGPLLGPLVVGATVWHAAPKAVNGDLWQQLGGAVCRRADRYGSRLRVDDSKQAYDRKKGIATLERTVLAFARVCGVRCATLAELLSDLGSPLSDPVVLPPWYRDLSVRLPLDARSACPGATSRLARSMGASDVRCCSLLVELVPEGAYNERVARTGNKATVLMEQVLRLISRAAAQAGDQDVHLHVDRLGGRQDYCRLLVATFPDRHVHVEHVGDECSRYRLASRDADWVVEFAVNADRDHLPVALASMLAKYIRELLMVQFNRFWRGWLPKLRPTAGYYTDAQRFLAEIGPVLPKTGLLTAQFVRAR